MRNIILERIENNQFVLIGEVGVNYYDIAKKMNVSPLDAAKYMIDEAKSSGMHAVKFQSYKASTLAAKESPSYWDRSEEPTSSQFELFQKFDSFGEDEYKELAKYCDSIGIEFLSTAFDIESADYLFNIMNIYKISSSDLNNLPFVKYQAKKGKPIMLSVGASTEEEIENTIKTIREVNNKPLMLLHCILEYPTPYEDANLNRIVTLKEKYPDLIIGYSDHTKPDDCVDVIKTAYNLGAIVIEKHFTLDKTLKGNDHYHAMDTDDVKKIINGINFINKVRGSYDIKYLENEKISRQNARRSLVATTNIKRGQVINRNMITFKRPGTGISASEAENVIGKTALVDICEDTILKDNMINWGGCSK